MDTARALTIAETSRLPNRRKESTLSGHGYFSCYNVYNNLNPFFSLVDTDSRNGTRVIREYGIFPIIPSVAWRIDF